PLGPRFGDHRIYSARRTSDLISERITLFSRKGFRDFEDRSRSFARALVNIQLPKAPDLRHPLSSILHPRFASSAILYLLSSTLASPLPPSSILNPPSSPSRSARAAAPRTSLLLRCKLRIDSP